MNTQAQQAIAGLRSDTTRRSNSQPGASGTLPARETVTAQNRASTWVIWAGLGLMVVLAAAAVWVVRRSTPKDPAAYRHVEPVEYYLYVPDAYTADQEWPLFVGIHGAGGNGLDCWNLWQTHAEAEGFILLCPSIPGDASGFYQDVGENTVWGAIGEVKKEYRVKQQMFLSGFSAGAFFIQGFTYHYPQYVSGLSILSAGVYLDPSMFINLVPMVVVIGGADHPDAVQASQAFVSNLQRFGFDVQYKVLPNVGHTVTPEGIRMTLELFRRTAGK